jgi:4-hydroxythreonine-4-phosphate dehydrogenase
MSRPDARGAAPLVVTPGDPRGIGPEVAVRALEGRSGATVLLGDVDAIRRFAPMLRVAEGWDAVAGVCALDPSAFATGEPIEVAALREGVRACLAGRARALVTGPIHKARLAAQGFAHPGHTEFLGELCGVERPVMAFVGGSVRVALVTVHVPLARVPAAVTRDAVLHVLRTADHALRTHLGISAPRLAVCGLNPHAGDGGLLGDEEITTIAPAVAAARSEGIDACGPVSAEAAFAHPEGSDLIVAMYHDQGLVPLKRVDFGRSVNWTLGLPIVRTSVDHGTADDLVGTGRARPDSMVAALELADALTRRPH